MTNDSRRGTQDRYLFRAASCRYLTIISTYEVRTGIRRMNATVRTGSLNLLPNRAFVMYRNKITVTGITNAKKATR